MKKLLNLLLILLLPLSVFSLDLFSVLYSDLEELDRLIASQKIIERQQQSLLTDLSEQLKSSEESSEISAQKIKDLQSISETQSEYLNRLQEQLRQAALIQQAQHKYQQGLKLESRLWKIGTIVLSVSTLGLLVWGLSK